MKAKILKDKTDLKEEIKTCKHLKEFLEVEINIINHHIGEHKYFQHIKDKNEAVQDFNEKYGWLIREMYCHYMCKDGPICKLAKEYFEWGKKELII